MVAYVLIKVPAKRSGGVVEILRTQHFQFVKEARAIYGDYDVIAKIEVKTNNDLDHIIMDVIQGIPQVEVTRTYLVIEKI